MAESNGIADGVVVTAAFKDRLDRELKEYN